MNPLSPADILRIARDDLAELAQTLRARLVIAPDPLAPLQMLASGPKGLLISLNWGGEKSAEEQTKDFLALTETLEVVVGFPIPPTAAPNAALADEIGGRAPLLDAMAQVRDRVRSAVFPSEVTSEYWRYTGAEPIEVDGVPLAAYRLTFEMDVAPTEPEPRMVGQA